jgi:Helix-turn-helix domain
MLRQDLAGYVLLGDPAVCLPIADGREGAGGTDVTRAEAAVLAVLRGDSIAGAAGRHGLDRAELERLVASYHTSGCDALDAALQARRGDRGP